jgi:hypothetical protein
MSSALFCRLYWLWMKSAWGPRAGRFRRSCWDSPCSCSSRADVAHWAWSMHMPARLTSAGLQTNSSTATWACASVFWCCSARPSMALTTQCARGVSRSLTRFCSSTACPRCGVLRVHWPLKMLSCLHSVRYLVEGISLPDASTYPLTPANSMMALGARQVYLAGTWGVLCCSANLWRVCCHLSALYSVNILLASPTPRKAKVPRLTS